MLSPSPSVNKLFTPFTQFNRQLNNSQSTQAVLLLDSSQNLIMLFTNAPKIIINPNVQSFKTQFPTLTLNHLSSYELIHLISRVGPARQPAFFFSKPARMPLCGRGIQTRT